MYVLPFSRRGANPIIRIRRPPAIRAAAGSREPSPAAGRGGAARPGARLGAVSVKVPARTTEPKLTRGQRRAARRAALTEIRIVQHAPTIEGIRWVAGLMRSTDHLISLRAAKAILLWAGDE